MDSSLRKWLFPFLSNLPSPHLLEIVHVTFSFVVPFPWPTDLHDWMQKFAAMLEAVLVNRFPRLRAANLTLDLRNAHTRPYDWIAFNADLQPKYLPARGVACKFKAQVYRPWTGRRHTANWAFLAPKMRSWIFVYIVIMMSISLYTCSIT